MSSIPTHAAAIKDPAEERPLVSIVIPFRDRPDEMRALLGTIPDRADIEILAVDDCSEAPLDPAPLFARARASLLTTGPGERYAGAARNIGIQNAAGEFLMFCDSDDLLNTGEFERLLEDVERSGGMRRRDVIYFAITSFLDTDPASSGTRHRRYAWLLDRLSETGETEALICYHPPWGKLVARRFLLAGGIRFDALRVSNDVMFNARLHAKSPKIGFAGRTVYRIREGNASLTSRADPETIRERLEVMQRYNELLSEIGLGRYRIPAVVHISRLVRHHPEAALKETLRAVQRGERLLPTPGRLAAFVRRQVRQRRM